MPWCPSQQAPALAASQHQCPRGGGSGSACLLPSSTTTCRCPAHAVLGQGVGKPAHLTQQGRCGPQALRCVQTLKGSREEKPQRQPWVPLHEHCSRQSWLEPDTGLDGGQRGSAPPQPLSAPTPVFQPLPIPAGLSGPFQIVQSPLEANLEPGDPASCRSAVLSS